jgi:hypothetical protein
MDLWFGHQAPRFAAYKYTSPISRSNRLGSPSRKWQGGHDAVLFMAGILETRARRNG